MIYALVIRATLRQLSWPESWCVEIGEVFMLQDGVFGSGVHFELVE